ncbi:hypothetical protein WJX72_012080 [[Myrmecia] bisecta]|uniref:Uncharacterized protein n=1 Tax=[Myrmecia] bisecta TaxID=41462 RepID=A0AAW1QCJ7_9CHLO
MPTSQAPADEDALHEVFYRGKVVSQLPASVVASAQIQQDDQGRYSIDINPDLHWLFFGYAYTPTLYAGLLSETYMLRGLVELAEQLKDDNLRRQAYFELLERPFPEPAKPVTMNQAPTQAATRHWRGGHPETPRWTNAC